MTRASPSLSGRPVNTRREEAWKALQQQQEEDEEEGEGEAAWGAGRRGELEWREVDRAAREGGL